MRMRIWTRSSFVLAVAAIISISTGHTAPNSPAKVGIEQGATRGYVASGGSFDVESGGTLEIESGGTASVAGTLNIASGGTFSIDGSTLSAAPGALNAVIRGEFCITGDCTETTTVSNTTLSVTKFQSLISSAGSEARGLAAPSGNGFLKIIVMTVDNGAVTLAGTNIWGQESTTCTFDDVGDSLVLLSVGGKWVLVKATGVTCA